VAGDVSRLGSPALERLWRPPSVFTGEALRQARLQEVEPTVFCRQLDAKDRRASPSGRNVRLAETKAGMMLLEFAQHQVAFDKHANEQLAGLGIMATDLDEDRGRGRGNCVGRLIALFQGDGWSHWGRKRAEQVAGGDPPRR
jgi:hypothetical protein